MNELSYGLVGLHQGLLKKVHLFLSMLMNAQISITCHCDINHTLVSFYHTIGSFLWVKATSSIHINTLPNYIIFHNTVLLLWILLYPLDLPNMISPGSLCIVTNPHLSCLIFLFLLMNNFRYWKPRLIFQSISCTFFFKISCLLLHYLHAALHHLNNYLITS